MKRFLSMVCAVLMTVMMFGQSYGILVNGHTYFAGESAGENDGYTQYLAHVQINAGDYCQLYDAEYEAAWVVPLDTWSEEGFTLNNDRYEASVSGCYDFYIKLKYGSDQLYIGNGSNCGAGEEIPTGGEPEEFVGFDARTVNLGEQIAAGLAKNLVNVTFEETSEGKYSINLVNAGEGSFSFGGVVFAYTNSEAGKTAFKTYGLYIQPNGKDREVRIPLNAGEKANVILYEACEGVLVNGVSTNLAVGDNILTATEDGLVLKSASTKPKIQAVLPVVAPVDSMTVYFVNVPAWEAVNAFVWAGENSYKAWPGEAMSKLADQINEKDVYAYTFPASMVNIIFNNGTAQTADLVWEADKPYYYDNAWYALEEIPEQGGDDPVVEPTLPVVAIAGSWDELWDQHLMVVADDSLTASFTLTLEAANYDFKVVSDGNWLSKYGEAEQFSINRGWNHADHVDVVDGPNFLLEADAAGEYIFTWTYADSTLVVTFPEQEPVQPTTVVFTVNVPEGTDSVFIAGSFNGWTFEKMDAVEGQENQFTISKETVLEGLEYKYLAGPDWNYVEVREGDANRTYAELDVVTAWYNVPQGGDEPAVEPTFPVVAIAGSWDELWDQHLMVVADDSLTASFTLTLAAANYDFKVVSDGKWLSKYGEAGQFSINRGWNHADHVDVVDGPNFLLEADAAGEYTFTWTYADSTLVVTFPEQEPVQPTTVVFTVNVPEGTDSVFIAGSFNGWTFEKMAAVEGQENQFTISKETVLEGLEYKYLAGPDWNYVEVRENDANRTYAELDVVTAWYNVPQGGDEPAVEPTFPVVAIAGSWDELWDQHLMVVADDSLTASFTLTLAAANYDFKVVSDGKWLSKYGEAGQFSINRGWNHADHVDVVDGPNFLLEADAAGEYNFTWTYADSTLVVTFPEQEPVQPTTVVFTVNVPEGTDSVFIAGSFNGWTFEKMDAVEGQENQFTISKETVLEGLEYKYLAGPDWNYVEVREGDANRTYAELDVVTAWYNVPQGGDDPVVEPDVYTVAGSGSILGVDWDVTATANDMTYNEETGIYTLVKENLTLSAFSYPYKVVKDHKWGQGQYPANDDNMILVIAEDGIYNITFTFNPATPELTALAEKVGEAQIEKQYLVVGQSMVANDEDWNNDAAINLMTTADEGLTYTLTVTGAELVANATYRYKIVEKGTWNEYFPNIGGDDATFTVEADGIYTLTYVYTVATSLCEVQATKTADLPEARLIDGYYLVGTFSGVDAWTVDDLTEAQRFNVSSTDEYGTTYYWLTADLAEGDNIKVVQIIHDAIVVWMPEGEGNNVVVDANHAGEAKNISLEVRADGYWSYGIEPNLYDGYYLVGTMNNWTPAAEYRFSWDETCAEGELALMNVTLTVNDALKVVWVDNGNISVWYPGDGIDNYVVDANHAGETSIYFRYDGAGGEDWYYQFFYVVPTGHTDIDNVNATIEATKILRDGQILIIKGEKMYNVMGQTIK